MLKLFGSSDIKGFVSKYLNKLNLKDQRIVDIPAGRGVTSKLLHDAGADVHPYDLFPEVFDVDGVQCKEADLMDGIPEPDGSADMVVCQEGIEHLPNQFAAFQEFNRILKPNGRLIITAPSISHLRAKVSNLLTESELYSRMPVNELDALWYANNDKLYFGHIFLIGIQKLRVLAVSSGFKIRRIHTVKVSNGSLIYAVLYPLIVLVNLWSYVKNIYKNDGINRDEKRRVYREQVKWNIHPGILFGRHLFVEFDKISEVDNANVKVTNPRY
ncbi:MAG: methyltransferase domain-containing protein [Gammaproteobacteria bacterium]|nr:methyltransferase domain-containing protein [Gammaproteobacteria bacterium]